MCVYNEEKNIGMCLSHFEKYVDKIVIFDDNSTDNTVSIAKHHKKVVKVILNKNKRKCDERKNRITVLNEAKRIATTEFPWVLCIDADERFEERFLKDLRRITLKYSGTNKVLSIHFRELWNSLDKYRTDGIWDTKSKGLLFQLTENMTFDYEQEHHIPWAYREIINNNEFFDYNLYHLKMILHEDREARKELYNELEPNKVAQPIGYDYLTDINNIQFTQITKRNKYNKRYIPDYYKQKIKEIENEKD